MKYYSLFIALATALMFSSCCNVPSLSGILCSKNKETKAHCGEYLTKSVTEVKETTHSSSKGGAYTTSEIVTKEVKVPVTCPDCLTSYKPCSKCCGGVSDEVKRRASAQGWNGNPHIGLIPTMKVLAE